MVTQTVKQASVTFDYSANDYLQLSLWYLPLVVFVSLWGFLWGFFLYAVFTNMATKYIKSTFNLEMMSSADEIFFLEDERNAANIIAFHKYEKWADVEAFKTQILRRARYFRRLKSTVKKFLGKYMFYELNDD